MYKNVGKELKFWSKVLVWIIAIIGAVIGAIVAFAVGAPGIAFISFIVCFGTFGYGLGYFGGMMLYSYAEIVDCIQEIKKQLCDEKAPLE